MFITDQLDIARLALLLPDGRHFTAYDVHGVIDSDGYVTVVINWQFFEEDLTNCYFNSLGNFRGFFILISSQFLF